MRVAAWAREWFWLLPSVFAVAAVALGVFVATFVYAMTVLRAVRGTADTASFVSQLAVTTAFVLVLASVVVFLLYLHHTAQAIRAATIIDEIAQETRTALDRQVPHEEDTDDTAAVGLGEMCVVKAERPGVVTVIDLDALADAAERSGAMVKGLRAVQVLDQLHDLLRRLAGLPLPARRVARRHGRVVVAVPATGFADFLDLALDEIHHWGGDDPRVRARLRGLLQDVHTAARPEHRPLIVRKLASWNELPPAEEVVDLTPSDIGLRGRPPGATRPVSSRTAAGPG